MTPCTAELPPLGTKRETAKFLKVSEKTIDRLREAGKLRAVKVGAKVMFRREDVADLLRRGEEGR